MATNSFSSPPWQTIANSNYFTVTNMGGGFGRSLNLGNADGSFFAGFRGYSFATNCSAAFDFGHATNYSFAINEAAAGVYGGSGYDFACNNSKAFGSFSFAGGSGSTAFGQGDFVFGSSCVAYDSGSSGILGSGSQTSSNGGSSFIIGNYGYISTNHAILICEQKTAGVTNYTTTNAIPFSILLSAPNSVSFQSLTNNVQSLSPFLATVGLASTATNNATVGTTGYTNTLSVAMVVYGFTGTGVVQTNADGYGFSRSTIATPTDILLQPGAFLIGTACSSQGIHAW
jgi:hypothetical protein